ncbi:hypothetical protein E8E11_006597 [Didymella keratinophila]|nr:hypothetical protein E8E11_006597 [Didymella keratinophila]
MDDEAGHTGTYNPLRSFLQGEVLTHLRKEAARGRNNSTEDIFDLVESEEGNALVMEAVRYPLLEFRACGSSSELWVVLGKGSSEQGQMTALEALAADVGVPMDKHRLRMRGFVLRDKNGWHAYYDAKHSCL